MIWRWVVSLLASVGITVGGVSVGTSAPPTVPPTVDPIPVHRMVGGTTATWYDDGPGLYGAVHRWHYGQHRYRVTVCALRCVTVTVRDYCAGCGAGIDLSPAAFRRLGYPLSRGRVHVTITATR